VNTSKSPGNVAVRLFSRGELLRLIFELLNEEFPRRHASATEALSVEVGISDGFGLIKGDKVL
jgi:hypothetical protein